MTVCKKTAGTVSVIRLMRSIQTDTIDDDVLGEDMIDGTCIKHRTRTYSANRDWFVQPVRQGLSPIYQDDAGIRTPIRRSRGDSILKGCRVVSLGSVLQSVPFSEEMDLCWMISDNISWVDCSNKSTTSLGEVQAIIPTGKDLCCVNPDFDSCSL